MAKRGRPPKAAQTVVESAEQAKPKPKPKPKVTAVELDRETHARLKQKSDAIDMNLNALTSLIINTFLDDNRFVVENPKPVIKFSQR